MRKILFAFLLAFGLLAPTQSFAQMTPLSAFAVCNMISINYALYVVAAQDAPNKTQFEKYIEMQLKGQTSKKMDASIKYFAALAWKNREGNPSTEGRKMFYSCEQSVFRAIEQSEQQQPHREVKPLPSPKRKRGV